MDSLQLPKKKPYLAYLQKPSLLVIVKQTGEKRQECFYGTLSNFFLLKKDTS